MSYFQAYTVKVVIIMLVAVACFVLITSAALATPTYGVLTVGNDTDTSGLACTGTADCNLRSAIEYANAHGGNWAIIFTSGVHTFTLGSPLIVSSNAISISANAGQTVFVNANNTGNAFQISGSDVMLNHLYIYGSASGFSNIWIKGSAQRVVISNNYIGTYPGSSGAVNCNVSLNSYSGIYIDSTGVIAPGSARAWIYGNMIGCNYGTPGDGIDILTDHVIVGVDPAGVPHGDMTEFNSGAGILIGSGATANVIRAETNAANMNGIVVTDGAYLNDILTNTVFNNSNVGIWLSGGVYSTTVRGNTLYGQGNAAIQIDNGAHDNTIGSAFMASGGRNRIFNNTREGIYISDANTHGNQIHGNWIGVEGANGHNGLVLTNGAHDNLIGDTTDPNTISGNGQNGVEILNGAHHNTLWWNNIGTRVNQTQVLSNTWSGVSIHDGAHDNLLEQNLISGNGVYGVVIDGSTTASNTLVLNWIGYHYTLSMPNGWDGVALLNGTFSNVLGGGGLNNFIMGNTASGIYVAGGSHNNAVMENVIASNLKYGILFDGGTTANNVVNGATITNNGLDGLAARNGALYNTWTHVSIYNNAGLGINTQAINEATHTPHPPTLAIVAMDRSSGLISGKANITSGPFFTKIELYRPAPDPSGYGEGKTFVGSTYTDNVGNWSIIDPAFTGCYTGFATETLLTGTGSTEFMYDTCQIFMPLVLKH